jgi:peptide deformylase
MRDLTIEQLGSPVLRATARDVTELDEELHELVHAMFATMYDAEGQGLAAPQVGISRRLAIVDVPPRQGRSHVLINPRIVSASRERAREIEGCLSIPGVSGVVERPAAVVVEALGVDGTPLRLEAEGELARCCQHEIDHLDGMLYIDHLSPLARRMLLQRYRKQRRPG